MAALPASGMGAHAQVAFQQSVEQQPHSMQSLRWQQHTHLRGPDNAIGVVVPRLPQAQTVAPPTGHGGGRTPLAPLDVGQAAVSAKASAQPPALYVAGALKSSTPGWGAGASGYKHQPPLPGSSAPTAAEVERATLAAAASSSTRTYRSTDLCKSTGGRVATQQQALVSAGPSIKALLAGGEARDMAPACTGSADDASAIASGSSAQQAAVVASNAGGEPWRVAASASSARSSSAVAIAPPRSVLALPPGELPWLSSDTRDTWEYPSNSAYQDRIYQLQIVATALFNNTLVSLPTGLGKTFIAAVVMWNYYRWFPAGQVVFLAPTRPLVSQQIEACYKIVGMPASDTAHMQACAKGRP